MGGSCGRAAEESNEALGTELDTAPLAPREDDIQECLHFIGVEGKDDNVISV
jgi:hypothetical protein